MTSSGVASTGGPAAPARNSIPVATTLDSGSATSSQTNGSRYQRAGAAAEEVLTVPVTLRAPAGTAQGGRDIVFVVESVDGTLRREEDSRFFGPP